MPPSELEALMQEETPTVHYHPRTVSKIVKRCEALIVKLIPIETELGDISSPTSAIITQQVVDAFTKIGGDFHWCVPYALLQARNNFQLASYENPSDADENKCRMLAAEILSWKVIARAPIADQFKMLSFRFSTIEPDGDESIESSALEAAVDYSANEFLSSSESQRVVFALWRGLLVQELTDHGTIEYKPYIAAKHEGFWSHFDPNRLAVPRYQFFFRIFLWLIFVLAYTFAIQTPERGFGLEDIILYVQIIGYFTEDIVKISKLGFATAADFWMIVNLIIYGLLSVAFVYRLFDIYTTDPEKSAAYRILCFQFLSSASPLIWMKLLTIFDLFQYFGTLQIVVWRMLRESAVFFTLLALLAIGFGQALTGLDIADDDKYNSTEAIIHSLIQGLLGSPAFDLYERGASSSYPFGMVLYYGWSILTVVILVNILVALFGSAYQECTDEAVSTFMSFFAGKTVGSIRAPDQYVYVAPFNLVESFFIIPIEPFVSKEKYAKINRYVMGTLFFLPLALISAWESYNDLEYRKEFATLNQEVEDYSAEDEDPEAFVESDDLGPGDSPSMKISTVPFAELARAIPNLAYSETDEILKQVSELKALVEKLK